MKVEVDLKMYERIKQPDGDELRIYEPAVFLRGHVLAKDGDDAIRLAKATGLASRPMVARA